MNCVRISFHFHLRLPHFARRLNVFPIWCSHPLIRNVRTHSCTAIRTYMRAIGEFTHFHITSIRRFSRSFWVPFRRSIITCNLILILTQTNRNNCGQSICPVIDTNRKSIRKKAVLCIAIIIRFILSAPSIPAGCSKANDQWRRHAVNACTNESNGAQLLFPPNLCGACLLRACESSWRQILCNKAIRVLFSSVGGQLRRYYTCASIVELKRAPKNLKFSNRKLQNNARLRAVAQQSNDATQNSRVSWNRANNKKWQYDISVALFCTHTCIPIDTGGFVLRVVINWMWWRRE